ncbi:neuroendocrine convertase 1 [Ixodes scapularis]|uniref:neuroendocrine convertase 1 n=1 Tax=Ixodes scapularis TaxID=6945 RepID=UPI0011616BE0|nr:neuroendocrine convertase 1 [Ixodes scapularis]
MNARTAARTTLLAALLVGVAAEEARYLNAWAVRVRGGPLEAAQLAQELGYRYLGPLRGFEDTYMLRKMDTPDRSRRSARRVTKRLAMDQRVLWAEQQEVRVRDKRHGPTEEQQALRFNDPLWSRQWYIHDTRSSPDLPELDHRVTQVWDMGFTGKGIVVTVMDDGLEWNHTDLVQNYAPEASYDFNDDDGDPFPRYDPQDLNNHGTRCAGEVAMAANNRNCGVGVAYEARIGGIRMLDGDVVDAIESTSLAFNVEGIDVFSASWGPSDDGRTVDGPKRLASEALRKGVTKGRRGRGSVYVWASGNGGARGDNCNCDGYASSPYTLSVSSASQRGRFPYYGEKCASTMAAAYSSGAYTDQKVATSDLHDRCTTQHTGTSASAPLAAGIVALVLQANPGLGWRDVQHLVAWTSDFAPLAANRGWQRNAAGLLFNSRFGFGLLDAHAMVQAALNWTAVGPQRSCLLEPQVPLPLPMESGQELRVPFSADGCAVSALEHVQLHLDLEYSRRGVLDAYLRSPAGSESVLLYRRAKDSTAQGFRGWTFLTVHFWGEDPRGVWTFVVRDKQAQGHSGALNAVSLSLSGTRKRPRHQEERGGWRHYADELLARRALDPVPEYEDEPNQEDPRRWQQLLGQVWA